jgi:hypothetical protein
MKKLLLAALLTATGATAQIKEIERYVALNISIDAKNAISGSAPTNGNQELDITASLEIHLGNRLTWGIQYESFKAIGYYKASWGAGYLFEPIDRLRVHVDFQTELILRQGPMVEPHFQQWHQFIGASLNCKVMYEPLPETIPNFYVGFKGGEQMRGDKKAAGYKDYFVFNGAVSFEYVIYFN